MTSHRGSSLTETCDRCHGPRSWHSESGLCKACQRLPWEPTHEEIAAECELIQATWTDYERERRTTTKRREWELPVIGLPTREDT